LAVGAYYSSLDDSSEGLGESKSQTIDEADLDWEYDDLMRNLDKYRGKIIAFAGTVQEVKNVSGDNYEMRISLEHPNAGIFDYLIVKYSGDRLLMGDKVVVAGRVESIKDSTVGFGMPLSMPVVDAIRLKCVSCEADQ